MIIRLSKTLYSNIAVLKYSKIKIFYIVILFFINVSIVTAPFFIGKVNSIEYINYFKGIENSLISLYEDEIDCHINTNNLMICSDSINESYGNYKVLYIEDGDDYIIDESIIVFTSSTVYIHYVNESDEVFSMSGNYSKLQGLDFSKIKTNISDGYSKDEYYIEMNDYILTGIYFSTLTEQISIIYLSQIMQIAVYITVITLLFLLINIKQDKYKIKLSRIISIIVLSMTGPALLIAIIGLFSPGIASILFYLIYSIRIMFIYYSMNNNQNIDKN